MCSDNFILMMNHVMLLDKSTSIVLFLMLIECTHHLFDSTPYLPQSLIYLSMLTDIMWHCQLGQVWKEAQYHQRFQTPQVIDNNKKGRSVACFVSKLTHSRDHDILLKVKIIQNQKLNTLSGLPYRQQTTVTVSLADHATYAAAEAITYPTNSTWNTSGSLLNT